jgi:hypothetical protein
MDVINDENLPKKIEDFIQKNFLSVGNIVLPDRKILGPIQYDRAELISIGIISPNETISTFENFCFNQSLIGKEICDYE